MRKFLALGGFALLALCFSIPASAGPHWTMKEVGWKISNAGPSGVFVRDTAFTCVNGTNGVPDTTEWFILDRLYTPQGNASVVADSVVLGYVVIVSDTSVIYTANTTAITTIMDIGAPTLTNVSSNTLASIRDQVVAAAAISNGSQLITTGDKIVSVPIIESQKLPNSLGTKAWLAAAMPIRMRITASSGSTGLASCRVYVMWQRDDISGY